MLAALDLGYRVVPVGQPAVAVGISNAGHLVYSDLCGLKNDAGQDLMEIALEYEVANAELFEQLWDGCEPGQIDPQLGWEITNYATSAALPEAVADVSRPDLRGVDPAPELVAAAQEQAVLGGLEQATRVAHVAELGVLEAAAQHEVQPDLP